MAATLLGVMPSGEATLTPSGGKLSRKYLVKLDNFGETEVTACTASGLPTAVAVLVNIPGAVLVNKKASRIGNSLYFEVTCDWETPENNDGTTTQQPADPLDMRPTCSVDKYEFEEVLRGDFTTDDSGTYDDAIRTAAGEVVDPPPMTKRRATVATIVKNYSMATDVFAYVMEFQDTVNEDTFLGAAPGTLIMELVKPVEERVGSTNYQQVTFVMKYNRRGWKYQKLLEKGSYYRDEDGKKAIHKVEGHPVEVLLNADGTKLADEGTPVYMEKQQYIEKNFASLGLPTTRSGYKLV